VYLVNTGWTGGPYGTGKRMSIKNTRACIDGILSGAINNVEFDVLPTFNLEIPKTLEGVDTEVLNPRNTWEDKVEYDAMLAKLASMFKENFHRYDDNGGEFDFASAGPQI
jgi:phosphoenolpyruvate carboxykinase (ATP)